MLVDPHTAQKILLLHSADVGDILAQIGGIFYPQRLPTHLGGMLEGWESVGMGTPNPQLTQSANAYYSEQQHSTYS
jgi:hypothetical protein